MTAQRICECGDAELAHRLVMVDGQATREKCKNCSCPTLTPDPNQPAQESVPAAEPAPASTVGMPALAKARRDQDSQPCPNAAAHTACPNDYEAYTVWAAGMRRTHRQERCEGCNTFAIWLPNATSLPRTAVPAAAARHANGSTKTAVKTTKTKEVPPAMATALSTEPATPAAVAKTTPIPAAKPVDEPLLVTTAYFCPHCKTADSVPVDVTYTRRNP